MGISGGVFSLVVALVFFVYALEYPYASELGPGPGMFPLWLSGILILLSLMYLYSAYKGADSSEKAPDSQSQKEMLFILISMGLYVLLLPIIGFNLSSILFLFAFLRKGYPWHTSLGISIVASVILFFLFTEAFASPLPVNSFGF